MSNTAQIISPWWVQTIIAAISGGVVAGVTIALINAGKEKRQWLRDAKLKAFSGFSKDLISLGNLGKPRGLDIWEFRAISAESLLLLKDKALIKSIRGFLDDLSSFQERWLSFEDIPDARDG